MSSPRFSSDSARSSSSDGLRAQVHGTRRTAPAITTALDPPPRYRLSHAGRARRAAIDGKAVRHVKVLEYFAFLSVPADDAERIADAIDGERVRGRRIRAEPAKV